MKLLLLLLFAAFLHDGSGLSLDPASSADLEQFINGDFTISLRHIRPRRKFRIAIEALFVIDFPGSNKFSFYLDRKLKRLTLDISSKTKVFSKHLDIKHLNESTTIRNLAISFQQHVISLNIDCKDVAKEELEFNLSKLYQNMEEPSVKLFRERKYPLHLDATLENALSRASCQKMSKKRSNLKRKDNEKSKKRFDDTGSRKRDVRDWYLNDARDNPARRGDIPIIHGDCDENLMKQLAELIALVKQLREEVRSQRSEITYLRTMLENCAGCKEPEQLRVQTCQHGNPCFPGVTCHDTKLGPRCGRCPRGYVGDGVNCKTGVTCDDRPCYRDVVCYDTVEGAHCGSCPDGFKGDGKICQPNRCEDDRSCASDYNVITN